MSQIKNHKNKANLSLRSGKIKDGNNKAIKEIASKGVIIIIYGFLLPHRVYFASLIHPKKN